MRRAALLLVAGGAIAALVLTASPPRHARRAAPRVTRDEVPVFVQSSGGIDLVFRWGTKQERLDRKLGVFRRAASLRDVLPSELQQIMSQFARVGEPLHFEPARARLLVRGDDESVFGLPTRKGSVCLFRAPLGFGPCVDTLEHGSHVEVNASTDARGLVWGLTSDRTVSVQVRLASRWLRAHLGRNGFVLRLPGGVVMPREVLVRDRDGARHVYVMKRCKPAVFYPVTTPIGPPPSTC